MNDSSWYEKLRGQYRPARTTLLLIAESAPDPEGGDRRFFYAPTLSGKDFLFRGVVLGLYDHRFPKGSAGVSKGDWLERMRDDGVFLIDVVPYPVNKLDEGAKRAARRDHAPRAIELAQELNPKHIVVCHAAMFHALKPLLREARLPLLHDDAIPFPSTGWQKEFQSKFTKCAKTAGLLRKTTRS